MGQLDRIEAEVNALRDDFNQFARIMEGRVAKLEVKAAIWGAAAGVVVATIHAIL